jgi:pantoate--beta-alanine ligase
VQATAISRILRESVAFSRAHSVAETEAFVSARIAASEGLRLEYFNIVNGMTLQDVITWGEAPVVGCITVFCGKVRLIDNIKIEKPL